MRDIKLLTLIFFIIFLQVTLFYKLNFFGITPNLFLVFIIYIIFYYNKPKNLWYILFPFVVVFDVFSSYPFGVLSLSLIFLIILLKTLLDNFVTKENSIILFSFVFFGTIAYYFLTTFFLTTFNFLGIYELKQNLDGIFLKTMIMESFYNLILIVFLLFLKESNFFKKNELFY